MCSMKPMTAEGCSRLYPGLRYPCRASSSSGPEPDAGPHMSSEAIPRFIEANHSVAAEETLLSAVRSAMTLEALECVVLHHRLLLWGNRHHRQRQKMRCGCFVALYKLMLRRQKRWQRSWRQRRLGGRAAEANVSGTHLTAAAVALNAAQPDADKETAALRRLLPVLLSLCPFLKVPLTSGALEATALIQEVNPAGMDPEGVDVQTEDDDPEIQLYESAHILFILGLAYKSGALQAIPYPPGEGLSTDFNTHLGVEAARETADILAASLAPKMLSLTPDCLSNALLGLAHLDLDPGPVWLGLAAVACLERCPSMSGWQAAASIHAFALLGYKPPIGLIDDMAKQLQQRMDELMPGQMALMIQSLSRLGYKPTPTWLRMFVTKSVSKLGGLTVGMFVRVVEAMWEMRYMPPRWWLVAMYRQSLKSLALAPSEDAAAMLYCLSRMSVAMPPGWLHETLMQARGVRGSGTRPLPHHPPMDMGIAPSETTKPKAPYLAQSQEQLGYRTKSLKGKEGSEASSFDTTPSSASNIGDGEQARPHDPHDPLHRPTTWLLAPSLIRLMYVVAREREDRRVMAHVPWAKQQLKRLVRSIGQGDPASSSQAKRRKNSSMPSESASSLLENGKFGRGPGSYGDIGSGGTTDLETLSPQLLVDLLYIMAELTYLPPGGTQSIALSTIMRRIQALMPRLSPNNLTTILVCLAVLRVVPSEEWVEAFFRFGVLRSMSAFRPQELANVLTAADHLTLNPGEDVINAVVARLAVFDLVEAAMFVRKLDQATSGKGQRGKGAATVDPHDGEMGASMSLPLGLDVDWLKSLKRVAKKAFVAKAEKDG